MRRVRYTKDYDYKANRHHTTVRKAGVEVDVPEAEFEAANAAGAVEELSRGKGTEPGTAAQKAGGSAAKSKG